MAKHKRKKRRKPRRPPKPILITADHLDIVSMLTTVAAFLVDVAVLALLWIWYTSDKGLAH